MLTYRVWGGQQREAEEYLGVYLDAFEEDTISTHKPVFYGTEDRGMQRRVSVGRRPGRKARTRESSAPIFLLMQ